MKSKKELLSLTDIVIYMVMHIDITDTKQVIMVRWVFFFHIAQAQSHGVLNILLEPFFFMFSFNFSRLLCQNQNPQQAYVMSSQYCVDRTKSLSLL